MDKAQLARYKGRLWGTTKEAIADIAVLGSFTIFFTSFCTILIVTPLLLLIGGLSWLRIWRYMLLKPMGYTLQITNVQHYILRYASFIMPILGINAFILHPPKRFFIDRPGLYFTLGFGSTLVFNVFYCFGHYLFMSSWFGKRWVQFSYLLIASFYTVVLGFRYRPLPYFDRVSRAGRRSPYLMRHGEAIEVSFSPILH